MPSQATDLGSLVGAWRLALTAADAGKAWDLRCHVREQLVTWIRETYPQALPRARMEATLNIPRGLRAA